MVTKQFEPAKNEKKDINVRPVTESDLEGVRNLFYHAYGSSYPYTEFYDDDWLKRSIYNDSFLFLLAEIEGQIVGTSSVYYEVGAFADLCGEFGRLVVDNNFRGSGIGSALMQARLNFAEQRLHFGIAECRTAHSFAQKISEKHGFKPIGFLPQKVLVEKRESLVLMGKPFGSAAELRRNNPKVIPEIYFLGQLALQNLNLPLDLIVVDDADHYPTEADYQVEELDEVGLSSLLRIERGRLGHRLVFGNLQLTYGLFQIQSRKSTYLVAKKDNKIIGAIGFSIDEIGESIKVVELINVEDRVAGFLVKELDRVASERYHAKYIEITVSAYAPEIQRTLYNLGFLPVAYCPSFVFHRSERLDTIKMAKLYVPFLDNEVELTEEASHVYALVKMGFKERQMGNVINEITAGMRIFQGLEDWELGKVASLCHLRNYRAGETVLNKGDESDLFFVVKEGELAVHYNNREIEKCQLRRGDFLGEIALVSQDTHTATAVATTNAELITLRHDEFENIIGRYPRIGLQVMRNIALYLGGKLATKNA